MSDNGRRYSTWAGVIPANGEVDIDRVGSYARLLSGDVGLQIRFDDEAPGNLLVGTGIDAAETFRRVTLINTTGADISVELAIGRGKIDDSRLTVSGVVDVRDPGDNSSFSDVIASVVSVLAMLGNDTDLRKPVLTLAAATYASVALSSTVTIVPAASNINGVIIRKIVLYATAGGAPRCTCGGNTVAMGYGDAANGIGGNPVSSENLLLPAGQDVVLANTSSGEIHCWYEVL